MMKNALLIVLYKKDIYTSQSIQSYLASKPLDTELTIWDNSPIPLPCNQLEILNTEIGTIHYYHTPQNISLSKIYNKVLDFNRDKDLFHIFDDDSNFSTEYFTLSKEAYLANKNIGLFAPQIFANEKFVSPGYFKLYKGGYFNHELSGEIPTKNTLIITSGMTLAIKRMGSLKFDENLPFYGIDTLFSFEYSDIFNTLFIFDYKLIHKLSRFASEPINIKLIRLELYKSSDLYILKKRKMHIGYILSLLSYSIKTIILKMRLIKE